MLLQPSALRRPQFVPGTLKQYNRNDMVCTVLQNLGTHEKPVICALLNAGKTEAVSFQTLISEMGPEQFLLGLKVWTKSSGLRYSLPLYGGQTNALLKDMVESGAMPQAARGYVPSPPFKDAVLVLEAAQYVEVQGDGYVLTRHAIEKLEFLRELSSPSCLGIPAEGTCLPDMTLLQLLHEMRVRGWNWSLKPVKEQRAHAFAVGEGKEWFTAGVTVSRHYLLCLLDAERLRNQHRILEIPHGCPEDVYELVFGGMQPKDACRKHLEQSKKKRKAAGSDGLVPDVDEQEQDEKVAESADLNNPDPSPCETRSVQEEQDEDVDVSVSDTDNLEAELEEFLNNNPDMDEIDASEPEPAPAPVAVQATAQPSSSSKGSLPRDHEENLGREPSSSSQALPRERAVLKPLHEQLVEGVAKYGSFSFSVKQAHSAPPHGGVEASCRFHRKSQVTGCKRFVRFLDATEESRKSTILLLQHWCNQASRFNRQRDHIRMPLVLEDLPPPALVAQQKISANPPSKVKTDAELDEEQKKAGEISLPKAKAKASSKGSAAPKAKQKVKAKAAPKEKGKSKAKAKNKRPADKETGSESNAHAASASSSSTSSSSSSDSSTSRSGSGSD